MWMMLVIMTVGVIVTLYRMNKVFFVAAALNLVAFVYFVVKEAHLW